MKKGDTYETKKSSFHCNVCILVLTAAPISANAATLESDDSGLGKVTIISDGVESYVDFADVITIYDENGDVVHIDDVLDYERPGGTFTLKNGWTASCNPEPLYYYGTKITMKASCSAGNASKLRGEAQEWDYPGSANEIIGNFVNTIGTWYGQCTGYLSWNTGYLFILRNTGSDPITVDSVIIEF